MSFFENDFRIQLGRKLEVERLMNAQSKALKNNLFAIGSHDETKIYFHSSILQAISDESISCGPQPVAPQMNNLIIRCISSQVQWNSIHYFRILKFFPFNSD